MAFGHEPADDAEPWPRRPSVGQAAELLPDPLVEGVALELGEQGEAVAEADDHLLAGLDPRRLDAVDADVDRLAPADVGDVETSSEATTRARAVSVCGAMKLTT